MLQVYVRCTVFSLFLALSCCFNFQFRSPCELHRDNGALVDCYPAAGGCPMGTFQVNSGCFNGEICCNGYPICYGIDCGDNGTCVNDVCDCDPGFNGLNCGFDLCAENTTACSINSVCNRLSPPELFNCTCDDGYSGPLCDQSDCGFEFPTDRLLNGNEDTEGSNPWVVRFGIDSLINCTGVIVAEQYVVTDLMCALSTGTLSILQEVGNLINDSGYQADVYVGDYNVTVLDNTETAYEIVEMHFHPNAPTLNYTEAVDMFINDLDSLLAENIVLIKLNDTITKGYGVNKACPPKPSSSFGCDPTCKVSAFGTTNSDEYTTPPDVRQVLPATLTFDEVCRIHRGNRDLPVATNCGVLMNNDSGICFNDHGGALICQDETTQRWSLQGILLYRPAVEYGPGYQVCSDRLFLYSDVYSLWPDIAPLML